MVHGRTPVEHQLKDPALRELLKTRKQHEDREKEKLDERLRKVAQMVADREKKKLDERLRKLDELPLAQSLPQYPPPSPEACRLMARASAPDSKRARTSSA